MIPFSIHKINRRRRPTTSSVMMFSIFSSSTQFLDRASIIFQWLTKNQPTGNPFTAMMTRSLLYSSAWTPFFLPELGKIAAVSFLGGFALGCLNVSYRRKNLDIRTPVSSFVSRARKLYDRTSSSLVSTARKVGEKIISFLILATIVTFRVAPVMFIRSVFASKHFFRLIGW